MKLLNLLQIISNQLQRMLVALQERIRMRQPKVDLILDIHISREHFRVHGKSLLKSRKVGEIDQTHEIVETFADKIVSLIQHIVLAEEIGCCRTHYYSQNLRI